MAGGIVEAVEGDGEGAGTCRVGAEPEAVGIRQYTAGCVHRPVGLDHAQHIVCVCSALACDGDAEPGVVTEAGVQRGKVGVEQARALRQGYGPRIVLEEGGRTLREGIENEGAEAGVGGTVGVVARDRDVVIEIGHATRNNDAAARICQHGVSHKLPGIQARIQVGCENGTARRKARIRATQCIKPEQHGVLVVVLDRGTRHHNLAIVLQGDRFSRVGRARVPHHCAVSTRTEERIEYSPRRVTQHNDVGVVGKPRFHGACYQNVVSCIDDNVFRDTAHIRVQVGHGNTRTAGAKTGVKAAVNVVADEEHITVSRRGQCGAAHHYDAPITLQCESPGFIVVAAAIAGNIGKELAIRV